MRFVQRQGKYSAWLLPAFCVLLAALPVGAYYPFLHWHTEEGRQVALVERFDLRALPGGAVPVVVSKSAELNLPEGDSWDAVLSQVRLAASQWSRVPNSSLRLLDAGEAPAQVEAESPHIQVLFEDLPPGVIAMAGPVAVGEAARDEAGAFLPITKSMVVVNANLQDRPSFGEAFFLTMVHELGHAIGLQHTFTSSVMSTGVTRSTTKATPLAEDDHAGVSFLYPGRFLHADTGTIRGKVMLEGEPLHFAPVTALLPSGEAVSTITMPDGSYEIRGLPGGQFYVFAQAAPTSSQEGLGPGQIVLPRNEAGDAIQPGPSFGTRFFPGVSNWSNAFLVDVQPGHTTHSIDIEVPRQAQSSFRGVTTYSFPGGFAVNPAILDSNDSNRFLVAYGPNLTDGQSALDGLEVDSIGAWIWKDDVFAYPWAPDFLQVGVKLHPFSATGPKTLLWKRYDDVYVQTAAFLLVGQSPPDVHSIAVEGAEGGATVLVNGAELGAVDRYLLDGMPVYDLGNPADPSQATAGRQARLPLPYTRDGRPVPLVALGRDGQSSLHRTESPLLVSTRVSPAGDVSMSPASLPAGTEALVVLESEAPVFAGTSVGVDFGHPSVLATRVWKLSDHKVVANVAVAQNAAQHEYEVAIRNDLAVLRPGRSLHVSQPAQTALGLGWRLVDVATGESSLYPGSTARLHLPEDVPAVDLAALLGERVVTLRRIGNSQFEFEVPVDYPIGLTEFRLVFPGLDALPVAIEIVGQPPRILSATVSRQAVSSRASGEFSARVRMVIQVPEGRDNRSIGNDLRIRTDGRSIASFQATSSEDNDNLLHVTFETRVPAREPVDSPLGFQVSWQQRLSPVYLADGSASASQ